MRNKIFITSDTHFGHEKILTFEPEARPFSSIKEHDEELVARWNSVVKKGDTVWHLGDVYLGGKDNHVILGRLNGLKRLVLGNHDVYPLECYTKYFVKIYGAVKLRDCLLTHIPVSERQLEFRFKYNLHGHMHSQKMQDSRYINVSVENTGLAPILLDDVLSGALT